MSESDYRLPPYGTSHAVRSNLNDLLNHESSDLEDLEDLGVDFNFDEEEYFVAGDSFKSGSSMGGASASSLSRNNQQPHQASASNSQSQYATGSESPDAYTQYLEPSSDLPSPPRRTDSSETSGPHDVVDLTVSPDILASTMPSVTRSSSLKKRRASTGKDERQVKSARVSESTTPSRAIKRDSSTDIVDLVDIEGDEAYNEFKAKRQEEAIKQQMQDEADRPVKLAEFQCIICMDNPTDLTVTHCGHLFCSECLHQALYAGQGKKSCPVCRQSVVVPVAGRKMPRNGYFVLEMKLMTANRKGKLPAGRR